MLRIHYDIDKDWLEELKNEKSVDKINHLISNTMWGSLVFESDTNSTRENIISPDTFWIWFDFFLDKIEKKDFKNEEYAGDIDGVSLNIFIKGGLFQLKDWNDNVIFETTTSKNEIISQLKEMIKEVIQVITKANNLVLGIDHWRVYFEKMA